MSFPGLAASLTNERIQLRSPPCCCCCCCLPRLTPSKGRLRALTRLLNQGVFFLPALQLFRLLIRLDGPEPAMVSPANLVPLILTQASFLLALYAVMLIAALTRTPLEPHCITSTFRLFMGLLVSTSLPKGVTDLLLLFNVFPCHGLLSPHVWAAVSFFLTQPWLMLALSCIATWALSPSRNAAFEQHKQLQEVPTTASASIFLRKPTDNPQDSS